MTNAKKTVGILSMQRVPNYGSFLQAYGLKRLLLECGAGEVHFIDIEQGRVLPGYAVRRSPLQKIRRIGGALLDGSFLFRWRSRRFYAEMLSRITAAFPLLGLDEPSPEHYDLAVVGSDEVFNCCQACAWGYTPQLFGRIPRADRVVSYAASFGHTTYEEICVQGIGEEIGATLKTMKALSVRDANSYAIVERLTGVTPEVHLDPVLVYGYSAEIESFQLPCEEAYMVVYTYAGRIKSKEEIRRITAFARSRGLKLYSIYSAYPWCDKAIAPATPFDVLAWFKGARYVVTDTFHGTIFSVITHRPFCSLVRENNRQKMSSLLQSLGLESRGGADIGRILDTPVDYDAVEGILDKERKRARAYLKANLEKI